MRKKKVKNDKQRALSRKTSNTYLQKRKERGEEQLHIWVPTDWELKKVVKAKGYSIQGFIIGAITKKLNEEIYGDKTRKSVEQKVASTGEEK